MAGSSSSRSGEECLYQSHVYAPNFVTVKLSGREMFNVWKTQMLCLLESQDMLDYINAENTSVLGKEKEMWRRSDALVKGWILGSLSEQTLMHVVNSFPNTDFTAKNVWDKLGSSYGPLLLRPAPRSGYEHETETRREGSIDKEKERMYAATLRQDFPKVERILSENKLTLRDKITINGNTALHVAVGTGNKKKFLEKMLNSATKDNQPLDMRNSEGSTLLHVAAIVGNTEAARMLVEKNHNLLYDLDNEGQTPVARAISNMHKDTYIYLSECYFSRRYFSDRDIEEGNLFDGMVGCELLVNMISSQDYGSAWHLFHDHKNMFRTTHIDTLLMAIAQNFQTELDVWEITLEKRLLAKRKETNYDNGIKLLSEICSWIKHETESRLHQDYYITAIFEATRRNADKFVKIVVSEFPNAIWSSNEDGHNIIQYAVINRSEKVYNLLYQMSEHKNIYKTIKDPFGNSLLHLAAKLAPPDKLNQIPGAALQMQRELQWFEEVKGFVCPLNIIQKNSFGETPQMIFTREHKELVISGVKWMKETAKSYTITAALITTIMFSAALTLPGGNNQDNGIPIFRNEVDFKVFAVCDAISLFTSVTSLLMFLTIFTARYTERDFIYALPGRFIVAHGALLISTSTMIMAFFATVILVFAKSNPLLGFLTSVMTIFPLEILIIEYDTIIKLVISTCNPCLFGRKSDGPFY